MRRRAKTRRNCPRDGAQPWDQPSARPLAPPQDSQGLTGSSCTRDVPQQASPRSTAEAGGMSQSQSREGCGTEEPEGALGGGTGGGQAMQGGGSATTSPPPPLTATDRSRAVRHKAGQPASQMRDPSPWPLDGGHTSGTHCLSVTQSDSAISGQELVGSFKLFYGAHMGTETRNVEFKRGGGEYLRSTFRSHLRRYACAFLNSGGGGSGGTLLVGVDDEGVVRGLQLSHRQEDQVRLLVDSVLRGFRPPLLPHKYSLRFLPVVRPGPQGRDLKVLALHVGATTPSPSPSPPPPPRGEDVLYQTDLGEVFLRRDGSVDGPLSAGAIQEWARQRWSSEVGRLQGNVDLLLSEQRLMTRELRRQNRTIAALHGQLRRRPPAVGSPAWGPTAGTSVVKLKKKKKKTVTEVSHTMEEGSTSTNPLLSPRLTDERWEVGGHPGLGGVGLLPAGQDPAGGLGGVLCCQCRAQDPGATRMYRLCHLM